MGAHTPVRKIPRSEGIERRKERQVPRPLKPDGGWGIPDLFLPYVPFVGSLTWAVFGSEMFAGAKVMSGQFAEIIGLPCVTVEILDGATYQDF